jgi:hypothetical protein
MRAYDHIADLLKEAGGKNGQISRAEADQLVDKLQKDGRGTEAMAARNLFKMIDARDAAPGNRVTGYDLTKSREFVESKMLENRDVNQNGYSQAEIAKMSPTGRALVELGQVLEMSSAMGRIGYDVPDQLYKEGRGTESLALGYFFSFIDHRDFKDGARVTDADIDKAVEYAKEKLLRNKDKNNNGYSKDEVEKFSTTAKAFLLVGQMIDAGIIKA